jgi:hypothetical protein
MELIIGTADGGEFSIDAQELVTGRTCVIAQSGAGKSWGIAVLCETLCKARIGFCLIDTEGEYFSLKDKFSVLWIGSDDGCDENIETVDLLPLMKSAVRDSIPVIYDVSETHMQEKVTKLANILYDISTELRLPYLLIVEEADKFIPQSKDSIKKIEEISRRGRKRGLGLLVATQRPALVVKNVLSQCNNQLIGRLTIDNDLKAVDLFFDSRKEVEELTTLDPGEFYVMGGLVRFKTKMRFGKRETQHRGLTPRLNPGPDRTPAPKALISPLEHEEDTPPAPVEISKNATALPLRVSREEILEKVRGMRRKKILRTDGEEHISSADLVYWPLVQIEVRYLRGVMKRSTRTTVVIIDGIHGYCADIEKGLRFRPCFAELIGLDEQDVRVISGLPVKGATETDLEAGTGLSKSAVRKAIKRLEERKLITVSQNAGEAKVFVPLLAYKIPRLGSVRRTIESTLVPPEGPVLDRQFTLEDIRAVLKGIESTAEIISSREYLYPLYAVTLGTSTTTRTLYIDAVTAQETRTEPGLMLQF